MNVMEIKEIDIEYEDRCNAEFNKWQDDHYDYVMNMLNEI